MQFRIFIVAYNNAKALPRCLKSISQSDINNFSNEIYVINNYKELEIIQDGGLNVRILNNVLRPDFSTGHLARNWNQAIINGFEDLKSPACDFVVCIQDDTEVVKDCFSKLFDLHDKYDFIQGGNGDQIMSFTPTAIKRIGIFDERFCAVGFQEDEYFKRAMNLHAGKSSINDFAHKRVHNPVTENEGEARNYFVESYYESVSVGCFHPYLAACKLHITGGGQKYFYYPYFEKDIETLEEQNYFGHGSVSSVGELK